MKKSVKNTWFLKVLALVLALGLLFGAMPAAALDTDVPEEGETVVSELPTDEAEPELTEEPSEEALSDGDAEPTEGEIAEAATEEETIAPKDDMDVAKTAEAPSGVTINVDKDGYDSYNDYYYTGIKSIEISFIKPDELAEDQLKAAFDQDLSETEDYDKVDWWDHYDNINTFKDLTVDGDSVKMVLDIEGFVDYKYNSIGFVDGKADGIYSLVFSYDIDGDGNPILYSQDFMITNTAPVVSITSTDGSADGSTWISDQGTITYSVKSAATGVKQVKLWKGSDNSYGSSTSTTGSFTVTESDHYYVSVVNNLDQESEKTDAGIFKIETKNPEIKEDDITYPTAEPDSDEWTNEPVDVTFKVTTGGSGAKQVKAAGETLTPNADGEYTLRFEKKEDIKVTVTSNAGREATKTITAPQIDTKKPDVESVKKVGLTSGGLEKLFKMLSFGLFENKAIRLTVFAQDDGAPITEISANDEKAVKIDSIKEKDGVYSQEFELRPGTGAEDNDSDYSNLAFTLKDKAGNETEAPVALKEIGKITLDGEETKEIAGSDLKELIDTAIVPDIAPITVTADQSKDDIYDKNITFSTDITETLTGISAVKVYFDTADKFDKDDNYKPNGAQELTDCVSPIDTDKKTTDVHVNYTVPDDLPSGEYVIYIEAVNNSRNSIPEYKKIVIDRSIPVIDNVTIPAVDGKDPTAEWVKSDVTVSFTVTDPPENGAGVDESTITVTGLSDGKTYEWSGSDGSYSFTTGIAQEYTINASDVFGQAAEEVTVTKLKIDEEQPHIVIADLEAYQTEWSKDEKTITFTVDDLSDYEGFTEKADKLLSGVNTIKVEGPGGKEYSLKEAVEQTADTKTYTFIADEYGDYTVTVTDIAGNEAVNTELTGIKVDNKAPAITKIRFEAADTSPIIKILHFLTFGIFGHESVNMIVEGQDLSASSGINEVTVSFTDPDGTTTKTSTEGITQEESGDFTVAAPIKVDEDLITDSSGITVAISDNVGHDTGDTALSVLFATDRIEIPDGFKIDGQDFEFVITKNQHKPDIGGFTPYSNDPAVTKEFEKDGTYWYSSGDFSLDFTVSDEVSKLHGINVTLNGDSHDITAECVETGTSTKLKSTYTDFEAAADPSTRNDERVESKNVTVNASALSDQSLLRHVSKVSEANIISVTAQGNNGVSATVEAPDIYIDDIAPEIAKFEFTGNGVSELSDDRAETKKIEDAVDSLGWITGDNYVYFFKDQAEVTVTATDTHSGIKGSGVRQIHFITAGMTDVDGPATTDFYHSEVAEGNNGDLTAKFTVPAGFRGSIYAYATDQVENDGRFYNPHNLIVENYDLHDANSGTAVTIDNTNYITDDNNGHPLYNGDVAVTLTIEDRFSGIKTVDYSFDGIKSSAHYGGAVTIDNSGKITDTTGGSWTVEGTDKNLITKISRTVILDSSDMFNSNDIVIDISGYDRSGYAIAETTRTISIDTTKPVIEVTYDPAAGTGNTYGSDVYEYYKVSRTMNVVVYERNFDPALFDWSGILNNYVSGDVPVLSAGENWSTGYSDYTDSSAHYASFTFANDGDYEITLNCTDEATNKADTYTGEKFTIDTVDPTVEVSLSGTAKNGKYYNETVTATITVHEHNFAEGDTYVTFTPKTDFDTSYGGATVTPSISGWSGSGDTHTTTVDFSSDGIYSFTFDYKDKALREAQQFSQSEFVVDKSFDKMIKFIDVADTTAYDGVIEPKVSFDDTNLDTASTTLTRISLNLDTLVQSTDPAKLAHAMNPASGSSRTDAYANFPAEVENDGIYELEATGSDLAGNTRTEKIIFSVNRFGSTFMLSDSSAEWVGKGYINTAKELEVIEINVNEVSNQSVSVSRNSQTEKLVKKTNFDFTSDGGAEKWYRYNYDIFKDNFGEEGNYAVTVSSTDAFKKSVSNRTAYVDEDKDIVRNCPISFVVDETAPNILIEGVDSDTPYGDAEKTIQIVCTDANIDPDSLVIKDENGKTLTEGSDYTMEALAGELDIELTVDTAGKHSLSVFVEDLASNSSEDAVNNFELNASVFTLFFHNTAAVIITAAVLAALIGFAIFMILKKRKQQGQ